ncbi:ABC transporter permease [Salsipaludibacter albus]|uniref:ABC transporter permease n=1 Tax=Salsipaludibacter albus TaxID=2849650 RepID=UPI001EE4909F|nr:ABC transporter permease [Salsipaludibacter albus]
MIAYAVKRILTAIPVLFGVVVVVFLLPRVVLGDPCRAVLGPRATEASCEQFAAANGLDDPIWEQFTRFVGDVLTFDLGESIKFSRPVTEVLLDRLPLTIELALSALLLAIVVGVPLGIAAARWHNSPVDIGTMAFANVGVSMPIFWLGLMLSYLFAVVLGDTFLALPPTGRFSPGLTPEPFYEVWGWTVSDSGFWSGLLEFLSKFAVFNAVISAQWAGAWDAIRHLILPTIALATIPMAIIARMTRSSLLDVLGRDYVRTAAAKGARDARVVRRHALRNALLPVVTIIGLQLGLLLGGAVLTETVFVLPGIGTALFDAITTRDYPIVQGFTLVIASTYVVVNLVVDLSYGYLDPRVRLQ